MDQYLALVALLWLLVGAVAAFGVHCARLIDQYYDDDASISRARRAREALGRSTRSRS